MFLGFSISTITEIMLKSRPKPWGSKKGLTVLIFPLLWKYGWERRIDSADPGRQMKKQPSTGDVSRYADMFAAMGAEPRLRIMRLLLSAHPNGLVVGEIGSELQMPNSTLSHHLDKLKNEDLVAVKRESTFLRYSANTATLQDLLGFLYAECCTRNQAIEPNAIVQISR